MNAKEMFELTTDNFKKNIKKQIEKQFDNICEKIKKAAENGNYQSYYENIYQENINKLEDLGFKIILDFSKYFKISWLNSWALSESEEDINDEFYKKGIKFIYIKYEDFACKDYKQLQQRILDIRKLASEKGEYVFIDCQKNYPDFEPDSFVKLNSDIFILDDLMIKHRFRPIIKKP